MSVEYISSRSDGKAWIDKAQFYVTSGIVFQDNSIYFLCAKERKDVSDRYYDVYLLEAERHECLRKKGSVLHNPDGASISFCKQ